MTYDDYIISSPTDTFWTSKFFNFITPHNVIDQIFFDLASEKFHLEIHFQFINALLVLSITTYLYSLTL